MTGGDLATALAIGGLIVNAVGLLLIAFHGGHRLGQMQADIEWLKEHISRRRTTDDVTHIHTSA